MPQPGWSLFYTLAVVKRVVIRGWFSRVNNAFIKSALRFSFPNQADELTFEELVVSSDWMMIRNSSRTGARIAEYGTS